MTRKPKPPTASFSALADLTRCRIVEILLAGPIPVHKLADSFAISRPAISRHLRVLKTAGLVAEVKKGRENFYTLRASRLTSAVAWLDRIMAPSGMEAAADEAPPTKTPEVSAVRHQSSGRKTRKPNSMPVAAERLPEPPLAISSETKQDRSGRAPKPAPIDQMGFDF